MRLSTGVAMGRALAWLAFLVPVLAEELALKASTYEGCFDSSEPLQDYGPNEFQSSGACQKQCVLLGKAVMGLTKGTNCWCGDLLPAADSKVNDTKCNSFCVGYDKENCKSGTILDLPNTVLIHFQAADQNNGASI